MNIMNRHMYGRENIMIREDMFCALWMFKKGKNIYSTGWYDRYMSDTDRKDGKVFYRRSQQGLKKEMKKRHRTLRGESELCCLQKAYDRASGEL